MYLVRSLDIEHLSEKDRLRSSLIAHFATPFAQDEIRVEDLRNLCESPFERDVYDELTQRGYWVTPQVRVGQYRIDMVVEGHNDARLAVECDGDKYHGADKWADDMQRQRVLERAGWVFWRCFASAFIRRRKEVLGDLLRTLAERGIEPIGAEGALRSVHTEHRVVSSVSKSADQAEVRPVEGPVSPEALRPDVPPISSISAGKVLPQPGEPRRFDSEDVRTEDAPNRPEFDDGDTSEIPTTTPGTGQLDALNTVKSLAGTEANELHQPTTPVKERTPMEFILKKEKETPGTWRFKEDKDERPLTIYLTKDQVSELGNPASIIVTIKAS
jgi:very-short-patch-repair endonuclease